MHYLWGSVAFVILSLLLAFLGVFLLKRKPWFVVWLRGTVGLLILAVALALALMIYPLSKFNSLTGALILAEISVEETEKGIFRVNFRYPDDQQDQVVLDSGGFMLSVATLNWIAPLRNMGVQNGYSLLSISTVDPDHAGQLSSHMLLRYKASEKAWGYLKQVGKLLPPVISLKEVKTEPILLKNGIKYEVSMTNLGVRVKLAESEPRDTSATEASEEADSSQQ